METLLSLHTAHYEEHVPDKPDKLSVMQSKYIHTVLTTETQEHKSVNAPRTNDK